MTETPRWISNALARIATLVSAGNALFTLKALVELAELGFDEQDACDILVNLGVEDSAGRIRSIQTREWLYIFKPQIAKMTLYIKVIIRNHCVVISFHEDEDDD